MRRNKKSSGLVKVLTATAAFAIVSSGTVSALAAEGYKKIMIGDGEGAPQYSIEEIANSDLYRQNIINTFMAGGKMYYVEDETDPNAVWKEFSESATADGIFTTAIDSDIPYPYWED